MGRLIINQFIQGMQIIQLRGSVFEPSKCLLKIQYLAILPDYEPILPLNGEWGGEREVWIVGVPTVTLWSSGVHIWSNIPHNKCIDAFEHSQNYMRLVCACKATLFPLNMCGFSGEKKRKICWFSNKGPNPGKFWKR